ncbi:MAG TPA: hypothetical protein VMU42_10395, partial [Candidatus Sulfotelmatobacter sp.]|nr:hypothetical protein [Candidatus Sulfotelmatobacter sp.]
IASEEFTAYSGGEWEPLGREALRGISAPVAVFRPSRAALEQSIPEIVARSRERGLSDAEAVVLMYRDAPES